MTEDLDRFSFSSYSGFNAQLIRWRYDHLCQYFKGSRCLEFGSSDGQGTEYLLRHFDSVTAVDGSPAAVAELERRLADERLRVLCSTFEHLHLDQRFDTVVLAHVLEHVENPQEVLEVAKLHLADDGVLIVDVPNGMSVHRQIGVEMGLLRDVTDLNDADISIGHRRVYTPETFKDEIRRAGLEVLEYGGLFLKVLSNGQIEAAFDPSQQLALLNVGMRYPDIASEIFLVVRPASRS